VSLCIASRVLLICASTGMDADTTQSVTSQTGGPLVRRADILALCSRQKTASGVSMQSTTTPSP
jgi:hypothetical protein